MSYVLESIDNLGKTTLVQGLLKKHGYHHVIHYQKPIASDCYQGDKLKAYQVDSFIAGFNLLEDRFKRIIFDRGWIGENVYAKRYRGYDGDYVFSMERDYNVKHWDHVKLVLLVTSNFDSIQDDGLSFDYSKRQEEQEDFIKAFEKSEFPKKIMIDIFNKNGYRKTTEEIIEEIDNG